MLILLLEKRYNNDTVRNCQISQIDPYVRTFITYKLNKISWYLISLFRSEISIPQQWQFTCMYKSGSSWLFYDTYL